MTLLAQLQWGHGRSTAAVAAEHEPEPGAVRHEDRLVGDDVHGEGVARRDELDLVLDRAGVGVE